MSRCPDVSDNLRKLCEPIVLNHSALLVDIEIVGNMNSQTVRLLVHKEPGISLQLCESIAREVGDILDIEDPVSGRYRLEVTSPGTDRPLVSNSDFERVTSRRLKVIVQSGRTICGALRGWSDTAITIQTEVEDIVIPRLEIAKATVEVEF